MITENYVKFKRLKEKDFNDILSEYWFFAFSTDDLYKWLEKLWIDKDKDNLSEKLLKTWAGWYILKEKYNEYTSMQENYPNQLKEFLENEENLLEAFYYELWNHEYVITYDITDTLNALWLKYDEMSENQKVILEKAKKEYLLSVE